MERPPPKILQAPIISALHNFYVEIYRLGSKIPKRDHFGIHAKIESVVLETLSLALRASLSPTEHKLAYLEKARIEIEILKHLIRAMHELSILKMEQYLKLQKDLQEISKIANGWIKYAAQRAQKER